MRDVTELSNDAQQLLARANREGDLDPALLQRVRGAVLAQVAASAGAAGATGTAVRGVLAAKTGAVPLGLGLGTKLVAVTALVAVAAAGGFGAGRRSVQPVTTPAVTTPAATAQPVVPAVPLVSVLPPVVPVPLVSPVTPPVAPASMPAVAPVTPPAAAASTTPWAHDIESLHDAQAALAAGDARAALRLASQVDPSGPFAGERAALSLVARCSIDATDPATAKAAVDFASAHAGTPLAERVRVACAR